MLSYRDRPRRSRAPLFFFLIALFFVSANYLLADKAHAAHGEMTVEFAELELTKRGPRLVLDYRMKPRDWRAVKRAGITPRLNLYLRDRRRGEFSYAYSIPLERRAGIVKYPKELELRGTRVVELEVVGFAGFDRVTQTRYGEACGERVRLRVDRRAGRVSNPHRNRTGHGGGHVDQVDHAHDRQDGGTVRGRPGRTRVVDTAAIIEACKDVSSTIDVSDCLQRARALSRRADPVATVRACGKTSPFNSRVLECLDKAKEVKVATARVIEACDDATDFPSKLNRCLDRAAAHRHRGVVRVIETCDEVTTFSSQFESCIATSEPLGVRADRVIRACDAATSFRSQFNACLIEAGKV